MVVNVRSWKRVSFLILLIAALSGCAGIGIIATSDPYQKLADARHLFTYENRPLPAERLIKEAITICKEKADRKCLAESYQTYGFFFRSQSIEMWETVYRRDGFLDRTATFDTRLEKSLEYLRKSIPMLSELKMYDALTNAYLNVGLVNERLRRIEEACKAYAKSLDANRKNLEANPRAEVIVPEAYANYPEYLDEQTRRAGCK